MRLGGLSSGLLCTLIKKSETQRRRRQHFASCCKYDADKRIHFMAVRTLLGKQVSPLQIPGAATAAEFGVFSFRCIETYYRLTMCVVRVCGARVSA